MLTTTTSTHLQEMNKVQYKAEIFIINVCDYRV